VEAVAPEPGLDEALAQKGWILAPEAFSPLILSGSRRSPG
jgi:hypothetical protein